MLRSEAQGFDRLVVAIDMTHADRAISYCGKQPRIESFQVSNVQVVEGARGEVNQVVTRY